MIWLHLYPVPCMSFKTCSLEVHTLWIQEILTSFLKHWCFHICFLIVTKISVWFVGWFALVLLHFNSVYWDLTVSEKEISGHRHMITIKNFKSTFENKEKHKHHSKYAKQSNCYDFFCIFTCISYNAKCHHIKHTIVIFNNLQFLLLMS